jgi:hypothetical protein
MTLSDPSEPLAIFWDAILSREPKQILSVFEILDTATRKAVILHLERMASEEGWLDEQRRSAQVALDVVRAPQSGS